jgi:hypothetical protein
MLIKRPIKARKAERPIADRRPGPFVSEPSVMASQWPPVQAVLWRSAPAERMYRSNWVLE